MWHQLVTETTGALPYGPMCHRKDITFTAAWQHSYQIKTEAQLLT